MVETVFVILIFITVMILALRRGKGGGFTPPQTAPSDERTYSAFERAPSLFVNKSELAFFHALHRALPKGYHLHSKTRLEDIARVKPFIKGEGRWKLRARVKSRHVDFLITDAQGVPLTAIELDGGSHNKSGHNKSGHNKTGHNKGAENADSLKDGIFEAIGLRLVRVRVGENFADAAQEIIKGL